VIGHARRLSACILAVLASTQAALAGDPSPAGDHATAPSPEYAIANAQGVDEESFVPIHGLEQWMTIRGRDRDNPVIMIVGGTQVDGPGATMSPYVHTFLPWERDWTVVQWDPRGTGKTFAHAGRILGPDYTLNQLVSDGLAAVDYVRSRLGERKIVLVGVNFGSTLGVLMVQARPQDFAAYVGVGQIVSDRPVRELAGYERLLLRATLAHDTQSIADLKLSGPYPRRFAPGDDAKLQAYTRANAKYRPPNPTGMMAQALDAPHWTQEDVASAMAAIQQDEEALGRDWGEHFDFRRLDARMSAPVFVIQGEDNDIAPTALARHWLDRLQAPSKRFIAIPVAGNHVLETHTAAVLSALNTAVRPTALRADLDRR
jgi:pimeloyl-ACP methyl ester carboxylesterase